MFDSNELDEDIIPLVRVINSIEGIETIYSCAGHDKQDYCRGYVRFKVLRLQALAELINRIEELRDIKEDKEHRIKSKVLIEVIKSKYEDETHFVLRIEHQDYLEQRKLIEQLTDLIKEG